jgi:hypothetical protein
MGTVSNISGRKSFTCGICGKNFEEQIMLDAHKNMEHSFQAESPSGVG